MAFETALSGLNAASSDLDIVGNNIANSNTSGFKSARGEFADIYAISNLGVAGNSIGQGVALKNVAQEFAQGQFEFTGNTLDMAINGDGFFGLTDENGANTYTRSGAFSVDTNGNIVNSSGNKLQGFRVNSDGNVASTTPEDMVVTIGAATPNPTTEVTIVANVDSSESAKTAAFDSSDTNTYNHSTSTNVYDNQGTAHQLTTYFRKESSNTWSCYLEIDGSSVNSGGQDHITVEFAANGTPYRWSNDGGTTWNTKTATSDPFESIDFDAFAVTTGADPITISDMDLSGMTQYGSDFSVTTLSQNGYSTGIFTDMDIDSSGNIFARFSNGQAQILGRIAVINFPSPSNLRQVGETSWSETFASGTAIASSPGTSGVGNIESGALEQSNVNLTEQLVKMITAQRNFQANAQMISTSDQITQTIINIR